MNWVVNKNNKLFGVDKTLKPPYWTYIGLLLLKEVDLSHKQIKIEDFPNFSITMLDIESDNYPLFPFNRFITLNRVYTKEGEIHLTYESCGNIIFDRKLERNMT